MEGAADGQVGSPTRSLLDELDGCGLQPKCPNHLQIKLYHPLLRTVPFHRPPRCGGRERRSTSNGDSEDCNRVPPPIGVTHRGGEEKEWVGPPVCGLSKTE
ncbi:hypothetical protein FKM82_020494 [Ascaphus truei]